MLVTILLLAVGLILIIKGGDVFVEAAVWVAEKTGIPQLVIGATVVSIATTLPEMIVSFIAAAEGKVDITIGNAVGSVTVNTGFIMALALIALPTVIRRKDYLVKSLFMLAAAAILVVFGMQGSIGLLPSILLVAIFVLAMADNLRTARTAMRRASLGKAAGPELAALSLASNPCADPEDLLATQDDSPISTGRELPANVAKFVLGAAAIVLGSQLLVDNGSALATLLGVPERIIAVSVVAVGTSLPELVTTVSAIAKKQCSLSVGNIIGANIIDLTLILPISSLIAGRALPVSAQLAGVDLPACLIIGCVALVPALVLKRFSRTQGAITMVLYILYLLYTTLVLR